MFDFDAGKLLVFGIVALAVIPPKDLPRVLRTVGQYVGRMRRMASEFQGQFMDAMKEAEKAAELESLKKELKSIDDSTKVDAFVDPVTHARVEPIHVIAPPPSEPAPSDPSPPDVLVKPPDISVVTHPSETHVPSAAP
jgi:sec-independent protein translocase protein TatB